MFVIRFILYKAPGERNPRTQTYKPMRYFYMDSRNSPTGSHMEPTTPGWKDLNDPTGVLANTLRPILKKIRDMVRLFGLLLVDRI